MNAHDVIRSTLKSSLQTLQLFLADMSDADLLVRPVPGANHLAWQLGHLITSEMQMLEAVSPGASPQLPHGFVEAHSKERASASDSAGFLDKATYLELFVAQRNATLKVLSTLRERDLDRPSPLPFRSWAPNVGDLLNTIGAHLLMHLGQVAVVRRSLEKPIVM